MTLDEELIDLLHELESIGQAIDRAEQDCGPHPVITAARARQLRSRQRVLAQIEAGRLRHGATVGLRHH